MSGATFTPDDAAELLKLIVNFGNMEFNAGYKADRGDNRSERRAAARAFHKIEAAIRRPITASAIPPEGEVSLSTTGGKSKEPSRGDAAPMTFGSLDALAVMEAMGKALETAEAALADIGDAEREDGDDLAWCEQRAATALPATRDALAAFRALRAGGGDG